MKRNSIFSDESSFESSKFFRSNKLPFQPNHSLESVDRSYDRTSLKISTAISNVDSLPGSPDNLTKRRRSKSVSWRDEELHRDDLKKHESHSKEREKIGATAKSSAILDEDMKFKIKADLSQSKYEIVRRIALQLNFTIARDFDARSNLIWIDDYVSMEMVSQLSHSQRINHFPAMEDITKKHLLAKELTRMTEFYPHDYSFHPMSWLWPDQRKDLERFHRKLLAEKRKIFLISRSIPPKKRPFRVFSSDELNREGHDWSERMLLQEHIEPLSVEGRRLRIRSYAIVTSLCPIRIFLFKDILASLETEEVKTNRHVPGKSQKHKFTADGLSKLLSSRKFNWKNFWMNLENVVIKTILLCLPRAAECYDVCRPRRVNGEVSVCFELLAFDLLLDANQKMWLVAVKQSPNLKVEDDVDLHVKGSLILSLFQLIRHGIAKKKTSPYHKNGQTFVESESSMGNSKRQKLQKLAEDVLQPINRDEEDDDDDPSFEIKNLKLILPSKKNENSRRLWMDILITIFSKWEESRPPKDLELRWKQSRFLRMQMEMKLRENQKKKADGATKLVEVSDEQLHYLLKHLRNFKVSIPGTTEIESTKQLDEMRKNWEIYEKEIRCFWFEKLAGRRQKNVIEMAMKSLDQVMTSTNFSEPRRTNVFRISSRFFNRMGRNLWDSFHSNRCWEKFIKDSRLNAKMDELECCKEVVRVCFDCLLVVYLCSEDNRGGAKPLL